MSKSNSSKTTSSVVLKTTTPEFNKSVAKDLGDSIGKVSVIKESKTASSLALISDTVMFLSIVTTASFFPGSLIRHGKILQYPSSTFDSIALTTSSFIMSSISFSLSLLRSSTLYWSLLFSLFSIVFIFATLCYLEQVNYINKRSSRSIVSRIQSINCQ